MATELINKSVFATQTVAELLASNTSYPEGSIIPADGFRYLVAESDATDHHLTTAGSVKLYVLPESGDLYNVMAFGAKGDGVTDDTAAIQAAIDACPEFKTVYFPIASRSNVRSWPKSYYLVSDGDGDGYCLITKRLNVTFLGSPGFRKPTLLCDERGKTIIFSEWKNISLVGMSLYGDGDIFDGGRLATCTGFKLRVVDNASQDTADYDGVISDCHFFGLHTCADIVGRNFEYSRNLHAGFTRGIYVEAADPDDNVGNADTMRGERIFDNRFHSSGGDSWVADVTGTAQAGASTTITLASGDANITDYYRGFTIVIESGTGSGQTRLITANNSSTKIATVSQAWDVVPDATSVYRIKSRHASASCIWFAIIDYPLSSAYEYGHHIINNQFDQVCRFYVGPTRALNLSNNTGYNLEGGKNADGLIGIINLLASDFSGETGGIVQGNTLRGVDQDADSIGIYCEAANVKIADNVVSTMQRHGIQLASASSRCHVIGNTVDQCSGATANTYDGIADSGTNNFIDGNYITGSNTGSRRMRYGINAAGVRTFLGLSNRVTSDAWQTAAIRIGGTTGSFGLAREESSDTLAMTYEIGEIKTLIEPTAGNTSTLRCVTAGTAGTLSGVTCTANATTSITVNSASNVLKGSYILISGDATPRRVIAISGTTVTLAVATTASGSGLAVSFSAPVFKAESTLAA